MSSTVYSFQQDKGIIIYYMVSVFPIILYALLHIFSCNIHNKDRLGDASVTSSPKILGGIKQ